jgi:lipopolysaccharide export system permease protein
MNKINIFLSKLYLKYFLLLFTSLELFFVGIDFMYNYEKLADSANIKVIYITYSLISGFSLIVPLSLVIAMIVLFYRLIKSSELIAIYSIGYSKKDVIKPIFLISFIISLFFISINFTELAYSKERMDNILKNNSISSSKENIFLKNYNQYIFFRKLLPIEQKAEGIKIFTIEDGYLKSVTYAKEAEFVDNYWKIKDATVYHNPKDSNFKKGKIELQTLKSLNGIEGFKPSILDNVYDSKIQLSITDAISAITLLQNQNLDTSKIRGVLYSFLIYPFFASFLLLIIFYYTPTSNRLSNVLYFNSMTIFGVLVVWGGLYSLVRFASIGTINPEFAVLAPIVALLTSAIYLYKKL